jgi:hypothetical protein
MTVGAGTSPLPAARQREKGFAIIHRQMIAERLSELALACGQGQALPLQLLMTVVVEDVT